MLPPVFRPMLASPAEAPFDNPAWLFEPKWDGFRCLAFVDRGRVELYSRTCRNTTAGYPEVVAALSVLPGEAVIDGELVVCGEDGRPRFQLIQQRNYATSPPRRLLEAYPVSFVAFDLCWLDGVDLRPRPLAERRELLEGQGLPVTPRVVGTGKALFEQVEPLGFEGVVAKLLDAPYKPGIRSHAWRKVKSTRLDRAVVVGFTPGTGGRSSTFGSLAMAQWDGDRYVFVGEVGTGFDDATLHALRHALDQIVCRECPVTPTPRIVGGVTWVEPGIVIRVELRGWTDEGRMRAASYKGVEAGSDPRSAGRSTLGSL